MAINRASIIVQIAPPLGIKILAGWVERANVTIAGRYGFLSMSALEMRGQVVASGKWLRSTTGYPTSELFLFQMNRVDMALGVLSPLEHLAFSVLVNTVGEFARVLVPFDDDIASHA
jgi:hypothetical protein